MPGERIHVVVEGREQHRAPGQFGSQALEVLDQGLLAGIAGIVAEQRDRVAGREAHGHGIVVQGDQGDAEAAQVAQDAQPGGSAHLQHHGGRPRRQQALDGRLADGVQPG